MNESQDGFEKSGPATIPTKGGKGWESGRSQALLMDAAGPQYRIMLVHVNLPDPDDVMRQGQKKNISRIFDNLAYSWVKTSVAHGNQGERSGSEGQDRADELVKKLADRFTGSGLSPADLRYIAVVRGPGSYTGVRASLSAARAMALVTGAALVGLDSLEVRLPNFDPDLDSTLKSGICSTDESRCRGVGRERVLVTLPSGRGDLIRRWFLPQPDGIADAPDDATYREWEAPAYRDLASLRTECETHIVAGGTVILAGEGTETLPEQLGFGIRLWRARHGEAEDTLLACALRAWENSLQCQISDNNSNREPKEIRKDLSPVYLSAVVCPR